MKVKRRKIKLNDEILTEIAALFAVLSDSSRLKIVRALMSGGMTVTALVAETEMQQGNVSKHLALLLRARLVSKKRVGNFAHYSIAEKKLFDLCELMCHCVRNDHKKQSKIFN